MKWKCCTKILALILSMSMTMQILPMQAFAQETVSPQEPETEEKEAKIIGEAIEKRTADTKYFTLDDGTSIAAVYSLPVHYQDDNGEWQDIDNTLTETMTDIQGKIGRGNEVTEEVPAEQADKEKITD